MWSPEVLALVAVVFLGAGLVKGVIGTGLPTVALSLLTAVLGLKEAMALILVPALVTNLWQAGRGGALRLLLRRFWGLLLLLAVCTWFGTGLLARGDALVFSGLLGGLLCVYAGISLVLPQVPPPGRFEAWLSPIVGGLTGLITGMTGTFIVPSVLYLQAVNLGRDRLIQAMGIVFTVSSLSLALALGGHGLLSSDVGLLSLIGLPTALLGQALGAGLRRHLSEAIFRPVFFCGLAGIGLYLLVRAFA